MKKIITVLWVLLSSTQLFAQNIEFPEIPIPWITIEEVYFYSHTRLLDEKYNTIQEGSAYDGASIMISRTEGMPLYLAIGMGDEIIGGYIRSIEEGVNDELGRSIVYTVDVDNAGSVKLNGKTFPVVFVKAYNYEKSLTIPDFFMLYISESTVLVYEDITSIK